MSEEDNKQDRKYFRVVAKIPLEVTFIPPAERVGLISEVLHEPIPVAKGALSPNQEDWDLIDWMKVLNEKLDTILEYVGRGKAPSGLSRSLLGLSLTFVNISAGGMSFISKKGYNAGDVLSMRMVLPETPPISLHIYGEVIFSKVVKNDFDVNVSFVYMTNEIRNDIATFVFNREREILKASLE